MQEYVIAGVDQAEIDESIQHYSVEGLQFLRFIVYFCLTDQTTFSDCAGRASDCWLKPQFPILAHHDAPMLAIGLSTTGFNLCATRHGISGTKIVYVGDFPIHALFEIRIACHNQIPEYAQD
jgi:hypothetical protein